MCYWWDLIVTHHSPTMGDDFAHVNICDLLCNSLLFDDEFQSFRQQLLWRCCRGTQLIKEQISEHQPEGLFARDADADSVGRSLREVEGMSRLPFWQQQTSRMLASAQTKLVVHVAINYRMGSVP